MKKALLVTLVLAAFVATALGNTGVNVKFVVNTAGIKDTILNTSGLTVTGDKITGWGAGVALTNIGGDYWSGTVVLNTGDTANYKYRLNGGWEDGDNHQLIVGAHDTTLNLAFYNATGSAKPEGWRPWGTVPDSMRVVYFRVNMLGYSGSFNPATDTVGVRGDKNAGAGWGLPQFQWGTTHFLTREGATGMASYFWSGAILFPKSKVVGGDTAGYKFIIQGDWGRADANNRSFIFPKSVAETTLAWQWFNNEAPVIRNNSDTVTVTFIANMSTATSKQSFSLGDTVTVKVGSFSTAVPQDTTLQLVKQGGTQNYAAVVKLVSKIGSNLDYQYYLVKNGASIREYYFNFGWSGVTASEQEKRQVLLTSTTQTVTDNVISVTDPRRQPYFENQKKLKQKVTVRWEVNLKPAYYAVKAGKVLIAGQGPDTVRVRDSITAWGVAFTGPTNTLLVEDWPSWGRALKTDTSTAMWDDGTHGDLVAHDTIYTRLTTYDTTSTRGKTFKFGVGGSDNESGFGLNHLENIDDTNPTYTLHTQFGSINPNFYAAWDYTNERPSGTTAVIDAPIPTAFALAQNFPNPFNPTTKIQFALPVQSHVSLKVYNVLGQLVGTLTDGVMSAGTHTMTFDAAKLASGVYFYRLEAGSFTSLKKMVLLK